MGKLYYLLQTCFLFIGLMSCTKEDDLAPSDVDDNYFAVPEKATDEVSVLRREFYEKNGVYLLFNDTLRHEQRGTYEDGSPIWFTETVDLNYNISSSGAGTYAFVYFDDQHSREVAASMIENHILPHLGEGWLPYSFLLLDTIQSYNIIWKRWDIVDCVSSIRCMAIGVRDAIKGSSDEQATFCKNMLFTLVNEQIEDLDDELFTEFYSFCTEYYGVDYEDVGLDWMYPEDEEMYELGFVYKPIFTFPYETLDRKYFVQEAVLLSEEEFEEKYGNYPIVMQKYEIIKEIITDLGYKF